MRKEYNDRWNAPLVWKGVTLEEYEAERVRERQTRETAKRYQRGFADNCQECGKESGYHHSFCQAE